MSVMIFLEGSYYVAFIILTIIAVAVAVKTYKFQSKKEYDLNCRLSFISDGTNSYSFVYGLEIYNSGNVIAKHIDVIASDKHLAKIEYIKPGESYQIPLGTLTQVLSGNKINIGNENTVFVEKGKPLSVIISLDTVTKVYDLNTDLLFNYNYNSSGSLKEISDAVNGITKKIGKK